MLVQLARLVNRRTVLVTGIIFCLVYAGLFALPRHINFSYAETPTCAGELALLPGMYRTVGAEGFRAERRGGFSAGKLKLASTKICFVPSKAPKKGVVSAASAPFGGWLFRARYNLAVGEAPRVLAYAAAPQALGQPLELKLSQTDKVFQYYMEADGKTQLCSVSPARLRCGVDKLGLKQGAAYTLKLQRSFGGVKAGEAAGVKVAILPALKVLGASVKPDEMIFAKPRSADFTLDKAPAKATAKLELMDGDKASPVSTQTKIDGARVQLSWNDDLPRERSFRLTLEAASAADGSTLDAPHVLSFRTSGGPKVLGVSIGSSGVAGNARAVVTFDQPLARDANIAGLASISGGSASISRQGTSQVVFALQDLPRCTGFSLNIAKGLAGENGVVSGQGWSFASRVSCRSVRTIGYSVRGRPIQAYFYGSGDTTILFTGGIHGEEFSGVYIMQDWVAHLDANAYRIPAGKQVVVVPNLNPDGISIGQRYNMHNVNLDRNFPSSDWISDIALRDGQILPGGGGVTPLSEPETQAIASLTSSLRVRAAFSFHAQGSLVGANKIADSVAIGSRYASAVGYTPMFYNPEEVMGYTLTGELETWLGERYGIPAVLIELPTRNGRFFSRHLNTLWAMVGL